MSLPYAREMLCPLALVYLEQPITHLGSQQLEQRMNTLIHTLHFASLQVDVFEDAMKCLQVHVVMHAQADPVAVCPQCWTTCVLFLKVRDELSSSLVCLAYLKELCQTLSKHFLVGQLHQCAQRLVNFIFKKGVACDLTKVLSPRPIDVPAAEKPVGWLTHH